MKKSLNAIGKLESGGSRFLIASLVATLLLAVALLVVSPSFHDKYFGMAKYESAAVGSLEKINALESQYASSHPDKGFACQLPLLRQTSNADDAYDPTVAFLDGTWSGYRFAVAACVVAENGIATQYEITATLSDHMRLAFERFAQTNPANCSTTKRVRPHNVSPRDNHYLINAVTAQVDLGAGNLRQFGLA